MEGRVASNRAPLLAPPSGEVKQLKNFVATMRPLLVEGPKSSGDNVKVCLRSCGLACLWGANFR